jgi:beta-glucosidase
MSRGTEANQVDEARIEALLEQMTLEEQVALLAGADFWTTVPIPRLGIPAIKVSDGPNGARGGGSLVGGVKAASFPVGIALASTWNTELVELIGAALAEEARSKGASVLLAPTVNIHRSTLNGRNFECYSEDPYLSARLAVAYINGLQRQGVGATVKHYVGNESEFQRMTISSEIDERALREIYLPPFEAAVKEAHTWAVMSSYNKVNGTYVNERADLQIDILKREWGFDGVVMSDWFATHSTAEAANGGLDLEMPGPSQHRGAKLVEAVRAGQVSTEQVKDSARRMLRLISRVGGFEQPTIPEEQAIDKPEHRALIRRAGGEGIVLLKNNGVLPLDPQAIESIAMIGPNTREARIMGGGSAQVNAHYRISPAEGITAQVGEHIELTYAVGGFNHKHLPLLQRPCTISYYNSTDLSGAVVAEGQTSEAEVMWFHNLPSELDRNAFSARFSTTVTPEQSGEHQFSLISAGLTRLYVDGELLIDNWANWQPGDTYFGTGSTEAIGSINLEAKHTYTVEVEYSSTSNTLLAVKALRVGMWRPLGEQEIEQAVAQAAAASVAVLFVGLNAEWDSEGADRPHMNLPGNQNELIARVAAANPNTVVVLQTGAPVTMPWLDQVAGVVQAWYLGQETGNAIADVLFGEVNPSGKLPQSFPVRLEHNPAFLNYPGENGRVRYGEGIFVGYRYYEKKKIEPLFPFGFGLSYTTFGYGEAQLSSDTLRPGESLTVSIPISNTGQRAGQEVVQLYVRDPQARLSRPPQELKGFAKVALEPGESSTVTFTLDQRALAYWDDAQHAWVAEAGEFEIAIGSSSRDIHALASFRLLETTTFGP